MPPPLDEPALDDDPDPPLLDPEAPLEVDPDPPLLDADPPLEVDPEPPLLDPEADPDPPLDPDSTEASLGAPGIRGTLISSRGLRDPHPNRTKSAMEDSGLMGFMDAWLRPQ